MKTLTFKCRNTAKEEKMKFTRTLLLVFTVALILPLILNVKNSNANAIRRRWLKKYDGHMFIYGYKFAKHHQKKYYALCRKRVENFLANGYGSDIGGLKIPYTYRTNQYFIEKCLQGVQTYKEIHRNK